MNTRHFALVLGIVYTLVGVAGFLPPLLQAPGTGAAKGDITLVIFGILVSVPIIVWGSRLVLKLMDRFPIVITLGGGLLGWIAGEMLVSDVAVAPLLTQQPEWLGHAAGVAGALLVIAVGTLLARRRPGH